MASKENDDKKKLLNPDDDEVGGSGQGGQTGASGDIQFKAFIALGENLRDDLLPVDEKRRLLSVHKDTHQDRVKRQKDLLDQRQALKEGKLPLQAYRDGLMNTGMNSQYKVNPILANKAQFSGIDRQVNALPTENVSESNPGKRDELTYQYQLRNQPENAPRFNPKPSIYR